MAITYPIDLPGVDTGAVPIPLILASPDGTKWRIYIGESGGGVDGVLFADSGATGTTKTLVLKAQNAKEWEIKITDAGIIQKDDTITSVEPAVSQKLLQSDDTGDIWALYVLQSGITRQERMGADASSAISGITFRPFSVVGLSQSPWTLEQQAQAHQGQLWAAEATIGPLDRDDAEEWIGALLSLNGREGTFLFGDPSSKTPRGTVDGVPLVNGASQTGLELLTKGWTASAEGVLKRGDWIQLGSGTTQRIYRVVVEVDADASGLATIDIWPRLRESPSDEEALVYRNTKGNFRLPTNEMRWEIETALLYGIQLQAMEAI